MWGCTTLNSLTWGCICFSGTLSEEDWKPPLPAYDFLQMMETAELPLHTSHRHGDTPAHHPPDNPGGDVPSQETKAEKVGSPGRDLRGTAPRLAAREKQGKRHSEL